MLSGAVGGLNRVWFDGVLDVHVGAQLPCWSGFAMLGIDMISLVLVMWALSLFISKNFRFIDLWGTLTLARAPMLLPALFGFFFSPDAVLAAGAKMSAPTILFGIFCIPISCGI